MNILLFGIIGIIGIIILIIGIINTNKNSKFTSNNSLLVSKYWDNYRVGDVFFSPKSSKHYTDLSFYDNVLYHKDKFPGSIASEYIKKNVDSKNQNIELLKQIIEEKKKQTKVESIDDSELILHMRIGDVLCVNLDWGDIDHYSKKNDSDWWNNVIKYIFGNIKTNPIIILI